MTEENQVQQEPQQVTTKNPKKVEAGRRLAAHNCRKKEELKAKKREEWVQVQKSEGPSEVNQYYCLRAVLAVGVIGGLGYYICRTKEAQQPSQPSHTQPNNPAQQPRPQSNKCEMDQIFSVL